MLLATEGTYPYHRGGVSTWCHALTGQLSEVDFTLLAITMHPFLQSKYALADNVRDVITVPLWGTEDPAEYGRHASFPDYLRRRWSRQEQVGGGRRQCKTDHNRQHVADRGKPVHLRLLVMAHRFAACCSCASSLRRSVMSRSFEMKCVILPSLSRTGVIDFSA